MQRTLREYKLGSKNSGVNYVNDSDDDSTYSEFVIVTEKEFKIPRSHDTATVTIDNTIWKISVTESRDKSPTSYGPTSDISVCCNYIASKRTTFHAEILFISDTYHNVIRKAGGRYLIPCRWNIYDVDCTLVVIRILEQKKHFMKKLADQWVPDVTFVVNGEKCDANRQYLANASPVFRKMLFGKFAEAKQSEVVLEGIESADVFKDFLLVVSSFGVQPNPINVVDLLKLAHQYDVPFLTRKCEEHLKFCYEITIENRIFLAAEYELNNLKVHTVHGMSNDQWKKMWKEHKEKLLKPEFLCLFDIIMDRWN